MNITEVRIKLIHDMRDKLRAFATITIEGCLVVRDLKVIDGGPKGLFVAMPSRKLQERCPNCAGKNVIRARYCNDCGRRLQESRGEVDARGKQRLYADIAHPIHQEGRDTVQREVVRAYLLELEKSKREDYVEPHFDGLDYHHYGASQSLEHREPPQRAAASESTDSSAASERPPAEDRPSSQERSSPPERRGPADRPEPRRRENVDGE